MVNLDNAQSGSPHQFLELLGGVARQVPVLKRLNHPAVLKLAYDPSQTGSIPVLELPGKNYQDAFEASPRSLDQTLADMTNLASALEHAHERSIAHGDIRLGHVYLKEGQVLLTHFERSSDVSAESGAQKLGRKKFTFYNNEYHAPELRYPNGFGQKWKYTHATLEGDVWSFGMMLAEALYLTPVGHDTALASRVGQPLWQHFDRVSSEDLGAVTDKDKQWKQVPLTRYFRHLKANAPAYKTKQPSDYEAELLKAAQSIINDCTHPDTAKRLGAHEVFERLNAIRQSSS